MRCVVVMRTIQGKGLCRSSMVPFQVLAFCGAERPGPRWLPPSGAERPGPQVFAGTRTGQHKNAREDATGPGMLARRSPSKGRESGWT